MIIKIYWTVTGFLITFRHLPNTTLHNRLKIRIENDNVYKVVKITPVVNKGRHEKLIKMAVTTRLGVNRVKPWI